ncbi:MAG TPA: hypothetical protein VIP70_00890 [Nitrososphaeraceae archaeon]
MIAKGKTAASLLLIGLTVATLSTGIMITPIQAETGKGTDVFKVIMTIFGVDKSIGDVVGIVTSNGVAKVKLLDAEAPYVIPINSSEGGGNIIEYVATFPNVTVNIGDEYEACVLPVNDLRLICTSGQNSPAARPEFVDISLNQTTTTALSEEVASPIGENGDEEGGVAGGDEEEEVDE